jgi:hypothetical protein
MTAAGPGELRLAYTKAVDVGKIASRAQFLSTGTLVREGSRQEGVFSRDRDR